MTGHFVIVQVRAQQVVDAFDAHRPLDEIRWLTERLLASIEKARAGNQPRDPRTGKR